MTSKRDFKKMIKNMCDELTAKAIIVGSIAGADDSAVDALMWKAIEIKLTALSHINVCFDRVPREFASGRDYNKARRAYYSKVYAAMHAEMDKQLNEYVKELNAMLPAEYREAARAAANA